ncbi:MULTISPECIES: hypothetical protein [unclassified Pseudomonas]|jgi:hypothetical protein|uniref:hypothetical protein n=1 Tax=unclassified Pseudomonas TaxID=196821 RepID=UPI001E657F05|nr:MULTISPECIES: hypothetical protein [unclassified Pseudomonas]MCE0913864.1 hypothetical protein [Pseudomonas sp. NMI760_13]MCP8634048.1 hypothetical protein [Pseudomonas sp. DVZ6]MDC0686071.1 hypothetical protein [Mitsuaria sp. RG]MDD7784031.1 hypothetical protein [Pseudomonas sp. DVZ24]
MRKLIDKSEGFLDRSKGVGNEFSKERLTVLVQVATMEIMSSDISSEMAKVEKSMSEIGRYAKSKAVGRFSELPVKDVEGEAIAASNDGGEYSELQVGRERLGTWPSSKLIRER